MPDSQLARLPPLNTLRCFALAAENLTGLQYEVVRSFPMPPRHARLRLTLTPR